jgi:translocation and assembly module TamA
MAVWLTLLLQSSRAQAETARAAIHAVIRYDIRIDAPSPVKALLQDNLSLYQWRGNERLDLAQLQLLVTQSKAEIETLVATEGYYTPAIDTELLSTDPTCSDKACVVHIKVEPGDTAEVSTVSIRFAGPILDEGSAVQPRAEDLRKNWGLPSGRIFRQADWEDAKRKLLQQLLIERYPQARIVESRAEVDVQTRQVTLDVTINSGPAVQFGALRVSGLEKYPATLVTNLNTINEGQAYNQKQLLELQRRLQDSGYFDRVEVSVVLGESDVQADAVASTSASTAASTAPSTSGSTSTSTSPSLTAPILVTVHEAKTKRVFFGAGYSTNTGYRGQTGYDQLNLFKGAVQFKSALVLETKKQSAQADFIFPVTPEGYRHTLSAGFKHEDIEGERTRTGNLSARRAWGPDTTERDLSLDFIREHKSIDGIDSTQTSTLSANYGVTLRRTDSLLAPSSGYLLTAQIGAGARISTGRPFARAYVKYTGYYPVSSAASAIGSNTLIVRGEGGLVAAKDRVSIPSDLLFQAGGDQSVRGYAYQSLGYNQNGAIVGGRYLAVGSVEAIHWLGAILPNWGVAAFVDAGNAADKIPELRPVVGYGLGARWRSPVGTLNLDVAYGREVRQLRLHFSVGVAF